MTTLGWSPRNPSESIGNKGVGFSRCVRLVIVPRSLVRADIKSSLTLGGGLRFAIDLRVGPLDSEHERRLRIIRHSRAARSASGRGAARRIVPRKVRRHDRRRNLPRLPHSGSHFPCLRSKLPPF